MVTVMPFTEGVDSITFSPATCGQEAWVQPEASTVAGTSAIASSNIKQRQPRNFMPTIFTLSIIIVSPKY
jgi:hypothetical protein